jgi:hypothetical protein
MRRGRASPLGAGRAGVLKSRSQRSKPTALTVPRGRITRRQLPALRPSSSEARCVNVNAPIEAAGGPSASRSATRWATTSVLPEAAAAMICTCEPRWRTASVAAPSSSGAAGRPGLDVTGASVGPRGLRPWAHRLLASRY